MFRCAFAVQSNAFVVLHVVAVLVVVSLLAVMSVEMVDFVINSVCANINCVNGMLYCSILLLLCVID